MNADELRALQAPIKQKYKDDAASALITMHAEGRLDQPDVACHVETFTGSARAGLHPAAGGSTDFACSGDMLLQALVACAGVTLNAVATAMGIQITGGAVRATGVMDFRGTLGMDKQIAVGFTSIDLVVSRNRKTVGKVFQCFQAVHLVYFNHQLQISNLTDIRVQILRFLGSPCQKYYLIC